MQRSVIYPNGCLCSLTQWLAAASCFDLDYHQAWEHIELDLKEPEDSEA